MDRRTVRRSYSDPLIHSTKPACKPSVPPSVLPWPGVQAQAIPPFRNRRRDAVGPQKTCLKGEYGVQDKSTLPMEGWLPDPARHALPHPAPGRPWRRRLDSALTRVLLWYPRPKLFRSSGGAGMRWRFRGITQVMVVASLLPLGPEQHSSVASTGSAPPSTSRLRVKSRPPSCLSLVRDSELELDLVDGAFQDTHVSNPGREACSTKPLDPDVAARCVSQKTREFLSDSQPAATFQLPVPDPDPVYLLLSERSELTSQAPLFFIGACLECIRRAGLPADPGDQDAVVDVGEAEALFDAIQEGFLEEELKSATAQDRSYVRSVARLTALQLRGGLLVHESHEAASARKVFTTEILCRTAKSREECAKAIQEHLCFDTKRIIDAELWYDYSLEILEGEPPNQRGPKGRASKSVKPSFAKFKFWSDWAKFAFEVSLDADMNLLFDGLCRPRIKRVARTSFAVIRRAEQPSP